MPGSDEQRELLIEWQALSKRKFEQYADAWTRGQISLMDFELLFKQELKDLYIASTWTAAGNPENTSFADYGRAGRALRDQYGFMHQMFETIGRGELSGPEIKNRLGMYAESSRALFERVVNAGLPQLPHVPGDGSTQCLINCNCTVEWQEVEGGWDVTWHLHAGESCPDCKRRDGKTIRIRGGRIENPDVWD